MANFKQLLHKVKAFAFDVDGVFTNGNIYLHSDGEMLRAMNIKDGYAVHYCAKIDFPIAIISGGNSESVRQRFRNLGITDIYLKSHDKMSDFKDFIAKYQIEPADVLYMGDDIPDWEVMQHVGLPTCPADAASEIKAVATYISDKRGGEGCVRDVIEQVLKVQGKWMQKDVMSW